MALKEHELPEAVAACEPEIQKLQLQKGIEESKHVLKVETLASDHKSKLAMQS